MSRSLAYDMVLGSDIFNELNFQIMKIGKGTNLHVGYKNMLGKNFSINLAGVINENDSSHMKSFKFKIRIIELMEKYKLNKLKDMVLKISIIWSDEIQAYMQISTVAAWRKNKT